MSALASFCDGYYRYREGGVAKNKNVSRSTISVQNVRSEFGILSRPTAPGSRLCGFSVINFQNSFEFLGFPKVLIQVYCSAVDDFPDLRLGVPPSTPGLAVALCPINTESWCFIWMLLPTYVQVGSELLSVGGKCVQDMEGRKVLGLLRSSPCPVQMIFRYRFS